MAPAAHKQQISSRRPLSSVLVKAKAAEKMSDANTNGVPHSGVPRTSSGSLTSEEYYRKLEEEKYDWIRRLAEKDRKEQEHSQDNDI